MVCAPCASVESGRRSPVAARKGSAARWRVGLDVEVVKRGEEMDSVQSLRQAQAKSWGFLDDAGGQEFGRRFVDGERAG